jgi:type II secretory pathway pseudopilin PulG
LSNLRKPQSLNYPITEFLNYKSQMILPTRKSVPQRRTERGYILITLILFVALIAIAAVVMAPVIAFQVKRDREEELIHRGVQYSRAMKHFVKKFGRYPTRIEELENTNQVRFLRKRYKDPITGKDFKILHMGDVQMSFGAGLAGAVPAGGLNPGLNPGGLVTPGTGGPGGPGGLPNGAINTVAIAGGLASAINGGPGQANPGSTFVTPTPGQNSPDNADNENAAAGPNQGPNPGAPGPGAPGPGAPGAFGATATTGSGGPQVFGGGPIVGVASTSKDKTIRIFNKKDHYYQWQFIYDPSSDRGGLLTTPNQPSLQGAGGAIQAGAPGAPGSPVAPGGGLLGQPGPGLQPGQPTQPGMQTPQMPPEQNP